MTGDHAADLAQAIERIVDAIEARKDIVDRLTPAETDALRTGWNLVTLYRESTGREDGPSAGAEPSPDRVWAICPYIYSRNNRDCDRCPASEIIEGREGCTRGCYLLAREVINLVETGRHHHPGECLNVASAVCMMRAAPPGRALEPHEREIHRADARLFREAAEALAQPTREELTDIIRDALQDSEEMDWTASRGARFVLDALIAADIIQDQRETTPR